MSSEMVIIFDHREGLLPFQGQRGLRGVPVFVEGQYIKDDLI